MVFRSLLSFGLFCLPVFESVPDLFQTNHFIFIFTFDVYGSGSGSGSGQGQG